MLWGTGLFIQDCLLQCRTRLNPSAPFSAGVKTNKLNLGYTIPISLCPPSWLWFYISLFNHLLAMSPVFQSCNYFLALTSEIWLVSCFWLSLTLWCHLFVDVLDIKMKKTPPCFMGEIDIHTFQSQWMVINALMETMDRILWKLGRRTAWCSWGQLRKKRRRCSSLVLVDEYVR